MANWLTLLSLRNKGITMPTPTYTPLANLTLGTSASSVTFSNIPATYRDLVIVSNLLNTVDTTDGTIRFNGDSANVSRVFMYGIGSGSGVSGSNTSAQSFVPRIAVGSLVVQIMDYSATDKHKTTLLTSNQAGYITYTQASRWASTAAINSVRLAPADGSFAAGFTAALYGIAS